jgi:hypothetical protein
MDRWRARFLAIAFGIIVTLAYSGNLPAIANMPAPGWVEGDRAATPLTTLAPAEILRETLRFDLTPLNTGQLGLVSATYQVRNPNPAIAADFLFISPGISSGTVTVNQTPVTAQPVLADDVALKFRDALKRCSKFLATTAKSTYLQFRASLPQGEFPIQVDYQVRPSIYDGFTAYRQYQVLYALAPAKDWQRFGSLDVSIKLPPGWQGSTNPAMTQSGDTLSGSFQGIPADLLTIDLQPSDGKAVEQRYNILLIAGLAIAFLLCLTLGWWLGRWGKRGLNWGRKRGIYWTGLGWLSIPIALVLLFPLCPILFWLVMSTTNFLGRVGVPSQHISRLWNAESGRIWGALIFGSITAIVAVVSFAIAALTLKDQDASRSLR